MVQTHLNDTREQKAPPPLSKEQPRYLNDLLFLAGLVRNAYLMIKQVDVFHDWICLRPAGLPYGLELDASNDVTVSESVFKSLLADLVPGEGCHFQHACCYFAVSDIPMM